MPKEQPQPEEQPERLKQKVEAFMKARLEYWYPKEKIHPTPIFLKPTDLDYPTHQDIKAPDMYYKKIIDSGDADRFGEYTINPEVQSIDWENIHPDKIKFLGPKELKGFTNKYMYQVVEHIITKYGEKYYIPGVEFLEWVLEKYDNAPPDVQKTFKRLQDGSMTFFPGSLICNKYGQWSVPFAYWDDRYPGTEFWENDTIELKNRWSFGNNKFVLIEK